MPELSDYEMRLSMGMTNPEGVSLDPPVPGQPCPDCGGRYGIKDIEGRCRDTYICQIYQELASFLGRTPPSAD